MPVIMFWLNAFIPQTVAGYTKVLSKGVHAAKTAIPFPGIGRFPFNMTKDWAAGYLTDQRSFDASVSASCRMQSLVRVEFDARGARIAMQSHRSSGTTEVNIDTGVQTGFDIADMSRCSFSQVAAGPTTIKLALKAAASDPLVNMAADIDYFGSVTITLGSVPGTVTVAFDGKIDDFPAYDCYAAFNGVTKALFVSPPPAGNTVKNLLGPATRPISATVKFP